MSATFGTKGLSASEKLAGLALHDVAYCAAEARTISYSPDLRRMWIELRQIAELAAFRNGATQADVAAAKYGKRGVPA